MITTDNSSNNLTMAEAIEEHTNFTFQPENHLLGCMAHVINLAAQDGLYFFGTITNTEKLDKYNT
ncbi:uncharacterized protein VP01_915g8 [Puccinia sorghi]|uniref:Uncharacterized protein n=1 Tax=Puccinia sorghi TaxID=27349 RepID=A0A0L6U7G1_9BASI|nr:uncharacterized protein VP01_915g8 [Puccinia sorghi]